jgi:hypothetical protein
LSGANRAPDCPRAPETGQEPCLPRCGGRSQAHGTGHHRGYGDSPVEPIGIDEPGLVVLRSRVADIPDFGAGLFRKLPFPMRPYSRNRSAPNTPTR